MLAAYRETGTLADAARAVGLSPRTAYRYEEEDILLMFALKASFPDRYRDPTVVVDSTAKDLLSELRKRSRIRKRDREETGGDDHTPVRDFYVKT